MVEANTPGAKRCKRAGCNKYYLEADNNGTACRFHPGKPIFHDLKKGWACCNQVAYEWSEFEAIVGCAIGAHTDDPAAAQTTFWQSSTVAHADTAVRREAAAVVRTAADFNREAEEKKAKAAAEMEETKVPCMTRDGSKYYCANGGCASKTFTLEENGPEACHYHCGEAVFHDLKKYWTCCNKDRPCHDWDDFLALPTCSVGEHKIKYKPAKK